MPSSTQLKLIEKLLQLPEMQVLDYAEQKEVGMMIYLRARNQKATCPRCGKKSERLHQNHWFLVRDLPLGNQEVYLKINRRQFKCDSCQKPFSEELDLVNKRSIEAVSIDLLKAYQSLIKELMPQAEIIADRFHIMKAVNVQGKRILSSALNRV